RSQSGVGGGPGTAVGGRGVRELPERRRRRPGASSVRRRSLRPPRTVEARVRSDQPVLPQPEHSARAMTPPSRFLIATWDGGGNTPAAFNLGSRLARRGHRVRMLGWRSMAARAAEAGIEFLPYRSERPWPAGLSHEDGWLEYIEPMLFGSASKADIFAAAAAFDPDALVLDCMLAAGFSAARELRDRKCVV